MNTITTENLAKKLQTAGDPCRLKILCYIISSKKACVSDIAKHLRMSVAIVSHHLQMLAKEDLLESERNGKRICYSFPTRNAFVTDLKKLICKYR
ncbi:MAG: metalloregulator ArsR/SmtB family transcription factor [Candidatus Paceibacterota bacterium]|jgi:DNA-binding transcriptional ArsR family regulator|nr:metalloregulator ArsR/SmtB family transcription factor [Candidatus Paceibacterota bacterium]